MWKTPESIVCTDAADYPGKGSISPSTTKNHQMPKPKKSYLGDSVYAEYTGYSIILTTENGCGPINTIHLEGEVWEALVKFVKLHTAEK